MLMLEGINVVDDREVGWNWNHFLWDYFEEEEEEPYLRVIMHACTLS